LINTPSNDVIHAYRALIRSTGSAPLFGTGVEDPAVYAKSPGWMNQLPEWATLLAGLPEVAVRGPISRELLREQGLKNVEIVGDPALLYSRWFPAKEHTRGNNGRRLRVLLNYGAAQGVPMWGTQSLVELAFTRLLKNLTNEHHLVTVVAICPQDVPHCRALLDRAGRNQDSVLLCDQVESYLSCVRSQDVAIAFKLHAGILAVTQHLPTILVEYSPKCRDFAASIGMSEYCVRSDRLDQDILETLLFQIVDRRHSVSVGIQSAVHDLTGKFIRYVQRLEMGQLQ
jgi:polysaccharide pyruvyl transferase WcaK-like protein